MARCSIKLDTGLLFTVSWLTNIANSGIYVLEGMSRGQRIAVRRETVVAFLGPAPRGPVSIPVAIRSISEYLQRFGSSHHRGPLQDLLQGFFENGGTQAIVVRISSSSRCNQITLSGSRGPLVLEAINPGPFEYIRASVDYDNIPAADGDRFNLVVHRLTSPATPVVEEQEIFRGVSVDPNDSDFVFHALLNSELVRVRGEPPQTRPNQTLSLGVESGPSYVYADAKWQSFEALTDYDLVGSNTAGTGIFALDQIPVVDMVCMIPGSESGDLGPVALFAAERYCRKRHSLLLMDPPSRWKSVADVYRFCREQKSSSPNVVTYFPRLIAQDNHSDGVCPSAMGAIAGRLAAGDEQFGIWASLSDDPITLRCRERPAANLSNADRAALERVGVNSLVEVRPGLMKLHGLVTFNQGGGFVSAWDSLAKRRTALFLIESIVRATRWSAFEDDGPKIWIDICEQIRDFLKEIFADDAYYVICNSETNRARLGPGNGFADESNCVTFVVGFALNGEDFLAFRFEHEPLECRVNALAWQPGIALAG